MSQHFEDFSKKKKKNINISFFLGDVAKYLKLLLKILKIK